MRIDSISKLPYCGKLVVHESGSRISEVLDSEKIIGIETRKDATLLIYDRPKTFLHNGYSLTEPTVFRIN